MDGIAGSPATKFLLMPAALLAATLYSFVVLADDAVPLKAHWEYYATVHHIDDPKSPPTHKSYMGPSSYFKYNVNPTKVVYLEWYKAEFLEAQQAGKNQYKTEFMLVKVDCGRRVYR